MRYQTVRRGDSIRRAFTARTFNDFAETADRLRGVYREGLPIDDMQTGERPILYALIENGAGEDRDNRSTAPIHTPSMTPDEVEVFNRVIFKSDNEAAKHGEFGIYLQDTLDKNIGRAVTSGIVACKLRVEANGGWIRRADVDPDDNTRLITHPGGSAQILWRKDPADAATAETVDALVRLGNHQSCSIPGKANQNIPAAATPADDNVTLWDGDPLADTSYTITAALDWMSGGQQISSGKELLATWFTHERKWRITCAECEDPPP